MIETSFEATRNTRRSGWILPFAGAPPLSLHWRRAWHAASEVLARAHMPPTKVSPTKISPTKVSPTKVSNVLTGDALVATAPIRHRLAMRLAEMCRLTAWSTGPRADGALSALAVTETRAKAASELSLALRRLMLRRPGSADLKAPASDHLVVATDVRPPAGAMANQGSLDPAFSHAVSARRKAFRKAGGAEPGFASHIHAARPETGGPAEAAWTHNDQDSYLPRDLATRKSIGGLVTQPIAAVLILNLDRFGRINQSFGTKAGDALLDQLTTRLDSAVTPNDIIAHGHGGEFVILRQTLSEVSDLQGLAVDLLRAFEMPFKIGSSVVHATATIGIARFPHDGATIEELMGHARAALFNCKSDSRGDWRFFRPGMMELLQAEKRMRRDLFGALSQGEFFILYEPLVGLHTGRIEAFEALLRWRHPELGVLTPNVFMPIAEQTGSHVPIANWLLREACRDAASWPRSINLAVKLPGAFFGMGTAESSVSYALRQHEIAASRLELGVPASFMVDDDRCDISELHGIRRLGVRIALDDLGDGFGYSGILNGLHVDKIKLDLRFLLRSSQGPGSNRLTVIARGHALGVVTVATSVTAQSDCDALREIGCMQAQGALLSVPVPAAEVRELILRQARPVEWP